MIGAELAVVAFGLLASASWGVADFSGGLAARWTPPATSFPCDEM